MTLSDRPGYDDVNGYRGYDEQFRFDGADNLLSHDMPLDSLKQFEVSHAKTSRQDDSPTPQDKAQHVDGQPAVKAIHANRLMLWADRHYQYDEFGKRRTSTGVEVMCIHLMVMALVRWHKLMVADEGVRFTTTLMTNWGHRRS